MMNKSEVEYCMENTPVGRLRIVASDRGLREIRFDHAEAGDRRDTGASENPIVSKTRQQLLEYFRGDRTSFDIPLDPVGTDFQKAVWGELGRIPFGTTTTYGHVAALLGDERKARAVGLANGRNPISIIVPCHRVIGADGRLTGFGGGLKAKRYLLDHERRVAGIPIPVQTTLFADQEIT